MRARHHVLAGLFLVGLAVRIGLLPYHGTDDVDMWHAWGQTVRDDGLFDAYYGNNFPAAWLFYAAVLRDGDAVGLQFHVALKCAMLAFDLGIFVMLRYILRRWNRSPDYALLFWLNPYFLAIYWGGYIDAAMGAAVVATIALIARRPNGRRTYLIAGVPLAFAFMYKPQCLFIIATLIAFAVARLVVRGPDATLRRALELLVAPAVLTGLFAAYFAAHGDISIFTDSLISTTWSPELSGHMPNIWLIVSAHYQRPGHSLAEVVGPTEFHTVARDAAAVVLVSIAIVAATKWEELSDGRLMWLFLAVTATVPILLTRAHENHFYVAGTLGVLAVALLRNRLFTVAYTACLLLQFVNLFALYGFGLNGFGRALVVWPREHYTVSVQVVFAVLLLVAWTIATVSAILRLRFYER